MKLTTKVEGRVIPVEAEIIGDKLWMKSGENTFSFDLQAGGSRKNRRAGATHSEGVMAPMPGKVTKIFVSENQELQKGQALLVMEAMKMEYTLKADLETSVMEIKCKVGDQVQLGQMLIKFNMKGTTT